MGTDGIGRDVFARVIWGARTSLTIMAIGAILSLVIGFPLGLLSGYIGGILDRLLVLIMDSIYAFPSLLLAALIAIMIGKGVFNIAIAITVIYIPLYFRVTRNQTLSAREELYVEAARAIGARPRTIMLSYIAFSVITVIPVIFSLSAADAILTAAGLSYLGFGTTISRLGNLVELLIPRPHDNHTHSRSKFLGGRTERHHQPGLEKGESLNGDPPQDRWTIGPLSDEARICPRTGRH